MRDSNNEPRLSLILVAAPDDPPLHSKEYQDELKTFAQSLTANGLKFSSRMHMTESASGGGFSYGEFGIIVTSVAPVLSVLLGAWLQAKYGRKVKVKFEDVEVEAATVVEAEKLIKLAEKHRKN